MQISPFFSCFFLVIPISCLDLKQKLVFMDIGEHLRITKSHPQIEWGINDTHIDIQLSYPSRGWIALGFSPNGGMDGTDVLFGYVDDRTHKVIIQACVIFNGKSLWTRSGLISGGKCR